ncbi:MAG: hypothetical protein WC476_06440 [Phycisphaerae bacterium]
MAQFAGSDYGKMIRGQFKDIEGGSELAMLAAPTIEELGQLKTAVAIMTPGEKKNAENLTDEQVQKIAEDARINTANLAIFINGFSLYCRNSRL